jgi:hypothetical protein
MRIIIGLLIVGAVVFGGYTLLKNNKDTAPVVESQQQVVKEESTTQPTGKKMAFAQFVEQGGAYECTVTQYVGDIDTTGTVFINKGKIRGEFTTQVNGMNVTSSMLVRDGFTYAWSSMAPKNGVKIAVQAGASDTQAGTSGSYSWNAEQIGDYDCKSWSPDEATFAIPTSVTFTLLKQ